MTMISKTPRKTDLVSRRGALTVRDRLSRSPVLEDIDFVNILLIMDRKVQVKIRKVKLKEVRRKLELTQEQVAKELGMDRTDLSQLETGKKVPEWIYKAIKLNELLKEAGYTLDDLAIPPYDEID